MSSNADERWSCPVCNALLSSDAMGPRHMKRWHPTEWVNQEGRQITYHPCTIPGCNRLNNNARVDFLKDHLSMAHGVDIPSKMRTTEFWYLRRKNEGILKQHIVQEATELNELNTKIRRVEGFLNISAVTIDNRYYKSRHGFDVYTVFETDDALLPTKADQISYLQRIRKTRNQVGYLCTTAGKDTRDGVLDELEMLMGWP